MGLLPAERQVWLRAYFPCCASCSITGHVHTGRTLNFVPGWMVWYHSNQLSRTCSLVSCRQVFASVTSFYPFTGGNSNLIQLTNNYCSCCMYVHCMYHYACLDQCIQSVHFFSFFFFFCCSHNCIREHPVPSTPPCISDWYLLYFNSQKISSFKRLQSLACTSPAKVMPINIILLIRQLL